MDNPKTNRILELVFYGVLFVGLLTPSIFTIATKGWGYWPQDTEGRVYHPSTIAKMIAQQEKETHVEVRGWVLRSGIEKDGDRHIDICDSADVKRFDKHHCMVFECIPKLMCQEPKKGSYILGDGIRRYDDHHAWPEIHPLESWKVVQQ